jgi:hypothetical protein
VLRRPRPARRVRGLAGSHARARGREHSYRAGWGYALGAAMYLARTVRTAACVGVLTLFSACGGTDAHTASRPTTAPAAPSSGASSGACRPGARAVCLTRSAGGRTVKVGVGWTIGVDLQTPRGAWSGPLQTGARLLRQIGAVRRESGGLVVSYRAIAPGKTALRAFERPVCAPTQACPQYILVWQVNVRVRGR